MVNDGIHNGINNGITGWWFGTFLKNQCIGNFVIPTDELIFFRGVEATNQKNKNLDFIQFLCRS